MLNDFHVDGGTMSGTVGGTMLIIFCNIGVDDFLKTAILACVGAVVSFCVSLLLKYLFKRFVR